MQYTATYIIALLGRSIRYKNISISVVVLEKKHNLSLSHLWILESFVLEYGGPSRRD